MLPAGVDYTSVHYGGLVILLVLLVARLVLHMRKLDDT